MRELLMRCPFLVVAMTSATVCFVASLTAQDAQQRDDKLTPVSVENGTVAINSENTSISFVGTHVGDDPKPRLGGFEKFDGSLTVDAKNHALKSIAVVIDTDSIWTEFSNLTRHLKTADFFDAAKFPKSEFRSKRIESTDIDGRVQVTGELTIMQTTAEISFPADVSISARGLVLSSEFTIDRTNFGMDKMQQGVENIVTIRVHVGRPTKTAAADQ